MSVICLRGGSEARIAELSRWAQAQPNRVLVVFGETTRLSDLPCVRYVAITPESEDTIFRQIAWEFLYTPFTFEGAGLERLARIQAEVHFLASDYADQGASLARNIFANLSEKAFEARGLFGKFPGVPAIVCGAGPSLTKSNLPRVRDKSLIFAGGAALDALKRLYIKPHFAAHVDPDPSHSPMATEAPLFYQLRTARRNVAKGSGQKFLVAGSGNSPLEKWAEKQLGLSQEPFDGGWTVGTFCIALAYHLGCDPIIFAGMDLSASPKNLYAPGVESRCIKEALVPVKNGKGEEVFARLDWLLARDWIETFVQRHQDRRWINASEGLEFQGVEKLRLDTLDLSLLPKLTLPDLSPLSVPDLSMDLEKACDKIEQGIQELERMFPQTESGTLALLQHDLAEETSYSTLLEPAWTLWKPLVLRHNRNGPFGALLNEFLFYRNLLKEIAPHGQRTLSRN